MAAHFIGTVIGNSVYHRNAVRVLKDWYTPEQIDILLNGGEVQVAEDEFDFLDDEEDE